MKCGDCFDPSSRWSMAASQPVRFDGEATSHWWNRGFHGTRMSALPSSLSHSLYHGNTKTSTWLFAAWMEIVKLPRSNDPLLCAVTHRNNYLILKLISSRTLLTRDPRYNRKRQYQRRCRKIVSSLEGGFSRLWQIPGNRNFQSPSRRKFDRRAEGKSGKTEEARREKGRYRTCLRVTILGNIGHS